MKKLHALIGVAAILLATVTHTRAQVYADSQILTGGTNNVAATATNTYAGSLPVFDLRYQKDFAYTIGFTGSGAGTGNVDFFLSYSENGSTWQTNATSVRVAASGTTPKVAVASVNNAGIGYYRLEKIENTNSISLTNIVVSYGLRKSVP